MFGCRSLGKVLDITHLNNLSYIDRNMASYFSSRAKYMIATPVQNPILVCWFGHIQAIVGFRV